MKCWIIIAVVATGFLLLSLLILTGFLGTRHWKILDEGLSASGEGNEQSSVSGGQEQEEGELVHLKLSSRRRGRRDATGGRYFVIQMSRKSSGKTLNLHLVRRYDLLSSKFRLLVDPYDDNGHPRQKRSHEALTEMVQDLQHTIYTGHVSSDEEAEAGWLAVSCIETGDTVQMIGMMEVNGSRHEITPVYNLEEPVGEIEMVGDDALMVQHELRPLKGQPERKCSSRKLSPQDRALSDPGLPSNFVEHNNTDVNVQLQKAQQQSRGSSSSPKVLELAIFTDPKFVARMKRRFPKDTMKNSVAYVLALVNNLNLLYKNPTLEGNQIEIRLNHMEMLTKPVKSLKTAKGREDLYLPSFCRFASKKNMKVGGWDHAMMLTGFDLRGSSGNGIIGVAYTGAMCDKVYSCSLIESFNFLGAYTMAHELGHSLGMPHDGEDSSRSCDSSKYIMAAIEGPGQVDWSSCSARNLKDFLRGRSSIPEASSPGCLRTSRRKNKRKKPISYAPKKKLPGEIFNAAQQCAMTFGKGISVPNKAKTSICKELACGNGTSTYGIQPALEGTPCGTDKWCRNGSCVRKKS